MSTALTTTLANTLRGEPDLEALLMAMKFIGVPRVCCHDDGKWSCHVDMHVPLQGVTFTVRSDWTHSTPMSAAVLAAKRAIEALTK